MRPDVTGPPPPLVWPDSLIQPVRPPVLVYLDQNHWIGLARARKGPHLAPNYVDLLTAARRAADRGKATFVLSSTRYVEMAMIKDPAQRAAVATVMEELTRFTTLLGRPQVARLELQSALHRVDPAASVPYEPIPLVGHGVHHAFGMTGQLRFTDDEGGDRADEARARLGSEEFDRVAEEFDLRLQRGVLAGPTDEMLPALLASGVYKPDAGQSVAAGRLEREVYLSAQLAEDKATPWRRGRLRDVVSAREFVIESGDFAIELLGHAKTVGDIVGTDRAAIRSLVRSMPGSEVAIAMKTQYHRDANRRWSVNDIHDIDAMALAVPYCDIVFTDNEARRALLAEGVDERMATRIPRRPSELAALLAEL